MWQSFLKSKGLCFKPNQRCLLCHDLAGDLQLCADCLPLITGLQQPIENCPYCAHLSVGGAVCGECQQSLPHFDRLWASFHLRFPLQQIITEYKFQQQWSYASILAAWMGINPPPWLRTVPFDAVVAVPLSKGRLFERGYNQSDLIKQALIIQSSLICSCHHEVKIKRLYRPPQSSLPKRQRSANVDGVFSIQNDVNERHLLLIDDVVTTCATLNELARKLKGAGAASVSCWVLARA